MESSAGRLLVYYNGALMTPAVLEQLKRINDILKSYNLPRKFAKMVRWLLASQRFPPRLFVAA